MITLFVEIVVKLIAYSILFWGVGRLSYPLVIDFLKLRKRSYRVKKQLNAMKDEDKKTSKFHEHITVLVKSTSKNNDDLSVFNFYLLTMVLLVTTFSILFILTKAIIIALFSALSVSVLPYMFRRFQLSSKRMETSYAFLQEYHIFLQSYQQNKDVYHTMVQTIQSTQNKKLKFAYMRVMSTMQQERNLHAFSEAMREFNYTINTSFSTRFANLLIKEYRDNIDISEALLDLHVDLQKREKDMAAMKSRRTETIILGYLPLVTLPLLVYMGMQINIMYSTASVFSNPQNVVLFMVALFSALISAMSSYLFNKPDADI